METLEKFITTIKTVLNVVYTWILNHKRAVLIFLFAFLFFITMCLLFSSCHSLVDIRENADCVVNGVNTNFDVL